MKHEGTFGRIMGSLQLAGYIEAIQNNKPYWDNKYAIQGNLLNDEMNTEITSKDGKKTYFYYTTPLFPGMIFWTEKKRDPKEYEFAKVLEEDKKKVDKLLEMLLGSGKVKVFLKDLIDVIVALAVITVTLGDDIALQFQDDFLAVIAFGVLMSTLEEMFDTITGDCDQII